MAASDFDTIFSSAVPCFLIKLRNEMESHKLKNKITDLEEKVYDAQRRVFQSQDGRMGIEYHLEDNLRLHKKYVELYTLKIQLIGVEKTEESWFKSEAALAERDYKKAKEVYESLTPEEQGVIREMLRHMEMMELIDVVARGKNLRQKIAIISERWKVDSSDVERCRFARQTLV